MLSVLDLSDLSYQGSASMNHHRLATALFLTYVLYTRMWRQSENHAHVTHVQRTTTQRHTRGTTVFRLGSGAADPRSATNLSSSLSYPMSAATLGNRSLRLCTKPQPTTDKAGRHRENHYLIYVDNYREWPVSQRLLQQLRSMFNRGIPS